MKVIANKTATNLQFGDILSQQQLVDLDTTCELANHMSAGIAHFRSSEGEGNSHIFITDISEVVTCEKFGDYIEIGYARRSGTGTFSIGVDVQVLTYSN